MTDEQLAAIRERAEAATPGPWGHRLSTIVSEVPDELGSLPNIAQGWAHDGDWPANAAFIADARTVVPALLAEVERLRSENAVLRSEVQSIAHWPTRTGEEEGAYVTLVRHRARALLDRIGWGGDGE